MDPNGPGSTLPLSTARSEVLKGIITRAGCRITRGNMQVKMYGLPYTKGLPSYKMTLAAPTPDHSLVLEQLVDVKNYVIASLELLDTPGNEGFIESRDAKSVVEQLSSLQSNVLAARTALKGASPHRLFPFHAVDPEVWQFVPFLHTCCAEPTGFRPTTALHTSVQHLHNRSCGHRRATHLGSSRIARSQQIRILVIVPRHNIALWLP